MGELEILWNSEKHEWQKHERQFSFEAVEAAIENGFSIDDFIHPDPTTANQRVLILELKGDICSVPYLGEGNQMFLQTIYQSRKLN
jgi:hypothetical protein